MTSWQRVAWAQLFSSPCLETAQYRCPWADLTACIMIICGILQILLLSPALHTPLFLIERASQDQIPKLSCNSLDTVCLGCLRRGSGRQHKGVGPGSKRLQLRAGA